ncbi:TPA: hypothetical protein ACP3ZG_001595 [Pseudomonas aeruginosa]|uniref:Uncharacterized protein n=1 Tax=Pseudomonas aeruginosa TaxID=287 RepID=A0A241XSX6_PSEAI|nr:MULTISPECIES: hypothetical protein [Pseudomonas]ELG7182103.1 hypothetical protein [Pseudomonas aeruginosa]MBH4094960.1 hypothetical protein [Pseudomonas aeruginosa]MBI6603323.1 hypothetical protein [Pseudomonas sp. S4_EA_1b]MBI8852518.1 hypothetical protein [Pseudomonas aeruginosa]OBY57592.1 hypothetical protein A9513_002920 [Pseudomonas sp. AU12215]
MKPVITKGKTEFFHSLSAPFDANAKTIIDIGFNTADAVQQPDGTWEVDGVGSPGLAASLAVLAERKARNVAFLPRHAEKKAARAAQKALARNGQVTLSDGTVIRRLSDRL